MKCICGDMARVVIEHGDMAVATCGAWECNEDAAFDMGVDVFDAEILEV